MGPLKRRTGEADELYEVARAEHEAKAKLAKLRAEAGEASARNYKTLLKDPRADVNGLLRGTCPLNAHARKQAGADAP